MHTIQTTQELLGFIGSKRILAYQKLYKKSDSLSNDLKNTYFNCLLVNHFAL